MRITFFIDNGYFYSGKNQIAHLALDKVNDDGERVRPKFSSVRDEDEYWDKHHIYVNEHYIKPGRKKVNSKIPEY